MSEKMHTEFRIYELNNRFRATVSTDGGVHFINLLTNPPTLDLSGKADNSVASIVIDGETYLITITPKELK